MGKLFQALEEKSRIELRFEGLDLRLQNIFFHPGCSDLDFLRALISIESKCTTEKCLVHQKPPEEAGQELILDQWLYSNPVPIGIQNPVSEQDLGSRVKGRNRRSCDQMNQRAFDFFFWSEPPISCELNYEWENRSPQVPACD